MAKTKTTKKTVNKAEPVKKLYKSSEDKVIAGICGGIAEYFDIDSVWVRLVAILLLFLDGIGILMYIILWVLVPENPNKKSNKKTLAEEKVDEFKMSIKKDHSKDNEHKEKNGHVVIGGILVIIGILFLVKNVFGWFNTEIFWGALIIGTGLILLMRK